MILVGKSGLRASAELKGLRNSEAPMRRQGEWRCFGRLWILRNIRG